MLNRLKGLFGCAHRHSTFPMTAKAGQRRSGAAEITGTYVVCLDCGKEFVYDWQQMKVVFVTTHTLSNVEVSPAATRAA